MPIKKNGGTGMPYKAMVPKWAFTNTVISYLIYQNQVGLGRVGNFTSWVHFP